MTYLIHQKMVTSVLFVFLSLWKGAKNMGKNEKNFSMIERERVCQN